MIKQRKNAKTCEKNEKATQLKMIIQLEEINQNIWAKEGRLKRYLDKVKQYKQTWYFKTMTTILTSRGRWHIDIPTTRCKKRNIFGAKYDNQKNIKKKVEWISNKGK